MLRKVVTILVFAACTLAAASQNASGWFKYPAFTGTINNLIETPDRVYYRAGSNLFSYSEAENENFAYSSDNELSDVNVKEIYYNAEKKYLAVAYENANIDLIYDNGKVINLPDIKDANVYAPRSINTISFYGDEMYVATDFGFVIFDTNRYEVKKSAVFNERVSGIVRCDDLLVIHHDNAFKCAPATLSHFKPENFTTIWQTEMQPQEIYSIPGTGKFALRMLDKFLFIVNAADGQLQQHGSASFSTPIRPAADGSFYTSDGTIIARINPDATFAADVALPSSLQNKIVAFLTSTDQLWSGTAEGIAKFDAAGNQLTGAILPSGCITLDIVNLMSWSPDHQRLYITRANPDKGRPGSLNGSSYRQVANVIENLEPRDVSVTECTMPNYWNGTVNQVNNGDNGLYGCAYMTWENPFDKDMYFVSTNWNGVYAIKNGKMLVNYNSTNSQYGSYANRADGVFIDPDNNLWIAMISDNGKPFLQMLPSQYIRPENIENVTKANWQQSPVLGDYSDRNFNMLFSSKCGMAFICSGRWGFGLMAYDTKGTYSDVSDDQGVHHPSLTDQDGKSFAPIHFHALAEDKNGQIWCGTSSGVCVVTDPSSALSENFTVRRPKVARNDGTNFADYLLESDAVLWIGVDPANNKWLATENSGLYLVNPDGTQILAHYTNENTPMASNTVYAVEQDPASNLVYVATAAGFYRFYGSTAPAAEDYSEIYAYPNPVRPDYTGWITIKGLTEGSLVKIVDAGGGLVAQTTASGGMAIWDGCNMQGSRVRSGVYYVFASSGPDDEQGKGAVTKIIVIN